MSKRKTPTKRALQVLACLPQIPDFRGEADIEKATGLSNKQVLFGVRDLRQAGFKIVDGITDGDVGYSVARGSWKRAEAETAQYLYRKAINDASKWPTKQQKEKCKENRSSAENRARRRGREKAKRDELRARLGTAHLAPTPRRRASQ